MRVFMLFGAAAWAVAAGVEQYTLPNGLRVILHADARTPDVHVHTRFHVGAKYERPGRTGFAHLFEHMLGQGVRPGTDFSAEAEKIGATNVNGGVFHDYIEMYGSVPAGHLERLLWLESERVARLGEAVTQANLDRQREIVRNERRQKVENRPYGRVNMLAHEHAFATGHPYGHDLIGSHADLAAATLEDVRSFHSEYFTADNISLAVVGSFDAARVRKWIEKYYGPMAPGRGVARPARWMGRSSGPAKVVEVRDRVPLERVFLVWAGPGRASEDLAALEVAVRMLTIAGGRFDGSRDPAAGDISAFEDASLVVLHAAAERSSLDEAEGMLAEAVRQMISEEASEEELERARNSLLFDEVSRMETPYGAATVLLDADSRFGSAERMREITERHRKVTAAQVRAAVARWMGTTERVSIRFRRETSTGAVGERPDYSKAPELETTRPFAAPAVRRARLGNGLEVMVVEMRGLPKVSVRLRFRAGVATNPLDRDGLGLVTMTAMKLPRHEKALAAMAAQSSAGADVDTLSLGLDVLSAQLSPALRQLADLVLRPDFGDRKFEDAKDEWVRRLQNPAPGESLGLALKLWCGRDLFGSAQSVSAITAEEAATFHKRFLRPDAASLTFAGDVSLEEAVAAARSAFGEWGGKSEGVVKLAGRALAGGAVYVVERAGAPQTFITMVLPGVARGDAEFAALSVVDRVLGGMFSSRLMQNLRQDKGYAYGAHSELAAFRDGGFWIAKSPVQADKTKESLAEFLREVRGLGGERPITGVELELARKSLLRGYAEAFGTTGSTADMVSRLSGHPAELDAVAAVTLEQANRAARKFARAESALFVLDGDRAVIEGAARELELRVVTMPSQ